MSHNTWIHKASRLVVRPLINTPVTPNQITTLRLVCGVGAAGLVASGDDALIAWGGGVFLLSMVLDRADGELARLSGKTSPWGHKYDLIADSLSNALIFAGLGIGLREGFFGLWAVPMGFLAGGAVAAILWLVMRAESLQGARAAEMAGSGGFDPDDGMLAIPVLIWLGLSQILLALAAVGAPAFAVFFFLKFRKFLFGGATSKD
ncbi:MAG: CDP-alcohol phosphatidyltransferase family protein [Rhodospirillales bacterium]|jgi:phosphatidylglycerophosphate synthase|nr:CDP-alcohol phosphatidyltransferase family protein [Rhodospirillales bacterium]